MSKSKPKKLSKLKKLSKRAIPGVFSSAVILGLDPRIGLSV